MSRLPIALVFVACLAACVPAPHVVHLRPEVAGLVVEDGKPIPDVELFLAKFPGTNHPCKEVGLVIPVSSRGRFSWAALQEPRLTDSLINPVVTRGAITALCIRHPAKGALIGAMLLMKQDMPLSLHLVCDVARPYQGSRPAIVSPPLGQVQHCETRATD